VPPKSFWKANPALAKQINYLDECYFKEYWKGERDAVETSKLAAAELGVAGFDPKFLAYLPA
jgi:hypothetical protein